MNDQHLDEDQIIVSIVDEKDLPKKLKGHLEACPVCQERRGALMAQLEGMGHMAKELAPRPQSISLPEPKVSWGLSFRWPVVASGLASLVIIAAVWGLMFSGGPLEIAPGQAGQQVVGLPVIEDILEEPVLPAYFQDIAVVSFEYFDDAFMDFVVPLEGSNEDTLENISSKKYDIEKKEA
ncbi:MAG: hypothetical protein JRJ51_19490 [Deltaproteobacteria bacterium]|nr:hypothetical protein [Deltaproteobacteria bacterium]